MRSQATWLSKKRSKQSLNKSSPNSRQNLQQSRCQSAANFRLYDQDSETVPVYYSRPGPGNYQIDQGLGKKTAISQFKNSPVWKIGKPKTVDCFATLAHFKKEFCSSRPASRYNKDQNQRPRSRSNNSSIERMSSIDVPLHRFVDFAIDLKTKQSQLVMLKPSLSQVKKNTSQQPFGTEKRNNPFPVKQEHATVCQHQRVGSSLRS